MTEDMKAGSVRMMCPLPLAAHEWITDGAVESLVGRTVPVSLLGEPAGAGRIVGWLRRDDGTVMIEVDIPGWMVSSSTDMDGLSIA